MDVHIISDLINTRSYLVWHKSNDWSDIILSWSIVLTKCHPVKGQG